MTSRNISELLVKGGVSIGGAPVVGQLRVAEDAAPCLSYLETYSAGANSTVLYLRRSDSDTLNVKSQTDDNDVLGGITFQGVDTGSNFETGAVIHAQQDGAAGARVPTELWLYTYSSTTSNHPQLVLKPNGRVGINTLVPLVNLHVTGNGRFTTDLDVDNDLTVFNDAAISGDLGVSGAIGTGGITPGDYNANADDVVIYNAGSNAGITIVTGTAAVGTIAFADGTGGAPSMAGYLQYDHDADEMTMGTGASQRLLLRSGATIFNQDGNDTDFVIKSDGDANMFFLDGGLNRVGIGTSSLTAMFEVDGDAIFNESGADKDFRVEGVGNPNALFIEGANGDFFKGYGANGAKLQLNDDSDSTGYFLQTSGAAGSAWCRLYNSHGSEEIWRALDNGNFGINTAVALSRLHVEGDCSFGDRDGNGDYVEIQEDADVNFVGGAGLQFGEIYFHGAGSDLVMAAQDTWYQIAVFDTDGLSNGAITPDHTSNHITVAVDGICRVSYSASLRSAASNKFALAVFINDGNDGLVNSHTHRDTTVAAKLGVVATSVLWDFAEGDTVELWAQRLDGGAVSKTLTFEHVTLNVEQIGGSQIA